MSSGSNRGLCDRVVVSQRTKFLKDSIRKQNKTVLTQDFLDDYEKHLWGVIITGHENGHILQPNSTMEGPGKYYLHGTRGTIR